MIMTIVESGGKLPKGASAAVFAMLGYVAAASIVAGIGDLGAGLLVLAMGGVAVGIVDYVMWRDVSRDLSTARTTLGSYVMGGPEVEEGSETPSTVGHFDPIRTEEPTTASVVAPASLVAPDRAQPGSDRLQAANDEAANDEAANDEPVPPAGADVMAAAVVVARDAAPEDKADAVGVRPRALAAPNGDADDLKRINGIGPANEAKLNALGIYHFDQIASWEAAHARWVGAYLAFPGRIEREDWVGQARGLVGSRATA